MNNIQIVINETRTQYPNIGENEIKSAIINYIEKNLWEVMRVVAHNVELPSKVHEVKKQLFRKRIKKEYRIPPDKYKTKKVIIDLLQSLKLEYDGSLCMTNTTSIIENDGKTNKETEIPVSYPTPFNIERRGPIIKSDRNFVTIEHFYETEMANVQKYYSEIHGETSNKILYPIQAFSLLDNIRYVANILSRNKVKSVIEKHDIDFGQIIELVLQQNDRDAFDTWLRLIDEINPLEHGVIINVIWTGSNVLSEEELIDYEVRVMLKSGIKPHRKDEFSAVNEIKKGRE